MLCASYTTTFLKIKLSGSPDILSFPFRPIFPSYLVLKGIFRVLVPLWEFLRNISLGIIRLKLMFQLWRSNINGFSFCGNLKVIRGAYNLSVKSYNQMTIHPRQIAHTLEKQQSNSFAFSLRCFYAIFVAFWTARYPILYPKCCQKWTEENWQTNQVDFEKTQRCLVHRNIFRHTPFN